MIQRFIEDIDKTIGASPIILSYSIQKQFGPNSETAYLKGNLLFIDSSVLEIAIYAYKSDDAVIIDKYRFHYRDKQEQMLFRYDNAQHHPEIPSFPHHKHTPVNIIKAMMPSMQDVLNEISAIILTK